ANAISCDGAGNLLAVRAGEDAEVEADAEASGYWCSAPAELGADADLVYHQTRWYDPAPGLWMAEDPNLSRYVADCGDQVGTHGGRPAHPGRAGAASLVGNRGSACPRRGRPCPAPCRRRPS